MAQNHVARLKGAMVMQEKSRFRHGMIPSLALHEIMNDYRIVIHTENKHYGLLRFIFLSGMRTLLTSLAKINKKEKSKTNINTPLKVHPENTI